MTKDVLTNAEPSFEEILMTMDIVDELRHEDKTLDKLANSEQRAAALKAKLRAYYERNGIAVSDEVLEAGVRAKLEKRFVYTPPKKSFSVRLAHLYVNRGVWVVRGSWVAAIFAGIFYSYQYFITWPEQQRLVELAQSFENQQKQVNQSAKDLKLKLDNSATDLSNLGTILNLLVNYDKQQRQQLNETIRSVSNRLQPLISHPMSAPVSAETIETNQASLTSKILAKNQVISDANSIVAQVQSYIIKRGSLVSTAKQLDIAWKDLSNLNGAANFKSEARKYYQDGIARLSMGDLNSAEASLLRMQALATDIYDQTRLAVEVEEVYREALATGVSGSDKQTVAGWYATVKEHLKTHNISSARASLSQLREKRIILSTQYQLRIVNEPGERTGVWRFYDSNRSKKSYYLVVDAISSGNSTVRLPILSQETNKVRMVSRFAVQVSESQYNKVGRDKQDDGILSNALLGVKARGQLTATYKMNVIGGYITSW